MLLSISCKIKCWLSFLVVSYNVFFVGCLYVKQITVNFKELKYQLWAGAWPHIQPPSCSGAFGSQDKVTDQGNLQEKSISQVPKQVLWHSMTIY